MHITTRTEPVRGTPMTRRIVLADGRQIHAQLSDLSDEDIKTAVRRYLEQRRLAAASKEQRAEMRRPLERATCKRCVKTKPLDAFPVNSARPGGYRQPCKECVKRYQVERRNAQKAGK